jgi:NAD(P)-dependent dehydrogenase (short-subunit alcohol dehydrogenase family)
MAELEGRVALVTGGAKGIGRAVALALAGAGAQVVICGRDRAALEALAAELGGAAFYAVCDVTQAQQVQAAFEQARARFGPVDILVNNAGITASVKLADMDEATWERVLRVNLTGAFLCCKAALPEMADRRWGRIINVASIAARIGLRYSSAYSASKHGLLGLTRSLALETARQGITVNAVCPGWTASDMLDAAVANIAAVTGRSSADATATLAGMSPMARIIAPEEVARAVLFLAGPAAGAITGQAINVDGGAVMS